MCCSRENTDRPIANEEPQPDLPDGWATATLTKLIARGGIISDGDWVESKDQDPRGEVRLIQLADIGDGFYKDKSQRFLTREKAGQLGCTFLHEGDLLIARMPEPLGRSCIFPGDPKPSVTAVDVCIVRTGDSAVDHRWIMHTMNSPDIRREIEGLHRGTTRKRISRRNLESLRLNIPPLAEQKRMVAKVEALLAHVAAARQRLARVPAILKRFRQSVLAAACAGRLTEDWREDDAQAGELPSTWKVFDAGMAYADARYGTSTRCFRDSIGTPVLRVPNIASGLLDLSDLKFTQLSPTEMVALTVHEGDVIVCRTNGSLDLIGKAAVVPKLHRPHAFASYLIRLRLDQDVLVPRYFHAFLSSPSGRDQIEARARTTAGQFNLNLDILRGLQVPLPPLAEQHEIVRRVDALFKLADAIENRVAAATAGADRLTQSILAKAFRGELVPTEAELARREGRPYEPASVLLERIRRERLSNQSAGVNRPRRIPKAKGRAGTAVRNI